MIRTGRVLAVRERTRGAGLLADAALGATVLSLEDAGDFDDRGGAARIYDPTGAIATSEVVQYGAGGVDDLANTLALSAGTANAWTAGDIRVDVYPAEIERLATVIVDDADDEGDEIDVRVPHALYDRVDVGVRAAVDREAVRLELVGFTWQIADVLGEAPAVDGGFIDPGSTIPPAAITDGVPPASSPVAAVIGGVSMLFLRWTPITNADAVTYEIHVSTVTGFVPGPASLAGETASSVATIRALPDGTPLVTGATYYVRLIAKDADGPAAAGVESAGALTQVGAEDLAVGSLVADLIASGNLLADVILAGTIRSATLGRRWEADGAGIRVIESDETVLIEFPTDALKPASFKGVAEITDLLATRATVDEALSIASGATATLAGGVANPSLPPTVTFDYQPLSMPGFSSQTKAILGLPNSLMAGHTRVIVVAVYNAAGNYGRLKFGDPDTLTWFRDVDLLGNRRPEAISYNSTSGTIEIVAYNLGLGTWERSEYDPVSTGWIAWSSLPNDAIGSRVRATGWLAGGNGDTGATSAFAFGRSDGRIEIRSGSGLLDATNYATALVLPSTWTVSDIVGLAAGTWGGVNVWWVAGSFPTNSLAATQISGIVAFRRDTGAYVAGSYRWAEYPSVILPTGGITWLDGSLRSHPGSAGRLLNYSAWSDGVDPTSPMLLSAAAFDFTVAYTFRDVTGTTHETAISPTTVLKIPDGARVSITMQPLPVGAVEPPNRWKPWLAKGTAVAAAGLYDQTGGTVNPRVLTAYDTSGALGAPTFNTFGSDAPAELVSAVGGLRLNGIGRLVVPSFAGPASAPQAPVAGQIFRDSTTGALLVFDGTWWLPLLGSARCMAAKPSNQAATAGLATYDVVGFTAAGLLADTGLMDADGTVTSFFVDASDSFVALVAGVYRIRADIVIVTPSAQHEVRARFRSGGATLADKGSTIPNRATTAFGPIVEWEGALAASAAVTLEWATNGTDQLAGNGTEVQTRLLFEYRGPSTA